MASASSQLLTLVLHADDFGMNEPVSAGIVRGFEEGLLTSASVLTNAPGLRPAIASWKEMHERWRQGDLASSERRRRLGDSAAPFDLGIHLNLTQGRPLTGGRYPAELLDSQGRFPGPYPLARRLLFAGARFRAPIERELSAQIEALLDVGIAPTHLNAHQYIDMLPAVSAVIPALMARYAIGIIRVPWERHLTRSTLLDRFQPANWCLAQVKRIFAFHYYTTVTRRGIAHPAAYFGTAHAGRIDLDLMQTFLAGAGEGCTEIGIHPGLPQLPPAYHDADGWHDPLADARGEELALLCSAELASLLEARQIRLGRLSELRPRQIRAAA
jgi:predicted glycoside hydrolase/deacetylase ChbG (UPF0249 family)